MTFDWIGDGLTDHEVVVVQEAQWMAQDSPRLARATLSKSWLADGVDEAKASVVQSLRFIGERYSQEGLRLLSMPFLEVLDAIDVTAMDSLADLAYFSPIEFDRIMAHPTIRAGITDDWANIVATLFGVYESNPKLVDDLLDPQKVTLDSESIVLPLAGKVELSVIRLEPGADRSIDLLEYAVRSVETFMNVPFPTGYVGLLFANAVSGTYAGTNFGTHVAIRPEYDVDDGTHEANSAAAIIAHEVGHYYWSGNVAWIDEGGAELIAIISEYERVGRPIEPENEPCPYVANLLTLEQLGASGEDKSHPAFDCNYSLGERIMLDLHRTLGDTEFRRSLRSLYTASTVPNADEATEGTPVGIAELRMAFGSTSPVRDVTARWYEGAEAYDLSGLDSSPINPTLATVSGRLDPIRIALTSNDCSSDTYTQSLSSGTIARFKALRCLPRLLLILC